jgi:hypothetical protein
VSWAREKKKKQPFDWKFSHFQSKTNHPQKKQVGVAKKSIFAPQKPNSRQKNPNLIQKGHIWVKKKPPTSPNLSEYMVLRKPSCQLELATKIPPIAIEKYLKILYLFIKKNRRNDGF